MSQVRLERDRIDNVTKSEEETQEGGSFDLCLKL
jgi:hypothetical protein